MAEKEYIERNAVVNGLRAAIKKYSDDKSEANIITALIFQRFAKEIEAIPAADVAPVKHGHWIAGENWTLDDYYYTCSICNEDFYMIIGTPSDNNYKYCPNCGAIMDGDADANGNDNKTPET